MCTLDYASHRSRERRVTTRKVQCVSWITPHNVHMDVEGQISRLLSVMNNTFHVYVELRITNSCGRWITPKNVHMHVELQLSRVRRVTTRKVHVYV